MPSFCGDFLKGNTMNCPRRFQFVTKSALHDMRLFAVDGLYWSYRQIRLAQKTGDPAKLREGLTGKKYYSQNLKQLDEERRNRAKAHKKIFD